MSADWPTISSLATAGGTLVLAIATFSSVRSANRSARVAEQSLLVGVRPLLMPSRLEDPTQKVGWVDQHWAALKGGRASVELDDGKVYVAASCATPGPASRSSRGGTSPCWSGSRTATSPPQTVPAADA